jgi:sugar lactone lactonase YvrE
MSSTQPASAPTMLLTPSKVRVLIEAMTGDLTLDHPEGVAIHRDGSIWCGGEKGQIYRVEPDGSSFEQVATTGGFCLGLAFDAEGNLFICDLGRQAVMRMDGCSAKVEIFSTGVPEHRFRVPNFLAFDTAGNLYVSDSWSMHEPGPGIVRLAPDGTGELWYDRPLTFANGLALSADGTNLYVAETFANRISRIPIGADGAAGERVTHTDLPGAYPDGLALDADGRLWVGCYHPSEIWRLTGPRAELVYRDDTAHILAHPTNIAFRDGKLITANLGRWQLSILDVDTAGMALPSRQRG